MLSRGRTSTLHLALLALLFAVRLVWLPHHLATEHYHAEEAHDAALPGLFDGGAAPALVAEHAGHAGHAPHAPHAGHAGHAQHAPHPDHEDHDHAPHPAADHEEKVLARQLGQAPGPVSLPRGLVIADAALVRRLPGPRGPGVSPPESPPRRVRQARAPPST